jgi:uncharacterized protein (DUF1501 family)
MQPLSLDLGGAGRFGHVFDRRSFLKAAGLGGLSWLTPLGHLLARQAEQAGHREAAQSVILLWMGGGPSQLETFDPHPDTQIAAGTRAIPTALRGVQLAEGFEGLAAQMESISLVRSMVSKEGDHERGTYLVKTGFRPDPTVVHPSIGAVCCHELPAGKTEVPRHISILPNQWPGRGGYLGDEYDAFKTGDPANKVPDVTAHVPPERDQQRHRDLEVVEKAFAAGRRARVEATSHQATVQRARLMMTSEQLKAFDLTGEPAKLKEGYGDSPFGRACLAARRLIEVGVRCVEVTLDGWDSHANNHEIHKKLVAQLDPAFAALVRDLKERGLLRRTVVLCMGEFGRTPKVNPLAGRDHWPKGFSLAIAGGGVRGGQVIGATDPEGKKDPVNPVEVADVHATVMTALGINPGKIYTSPIGRTVKLSEGRVIQGILS